MPQHVPSSVSDAVLKKLRERSSTLTKGLGLFGLGATKIAGPALPFNVPPELLLQMLSGGGEATASGQVGSPEWAYPPNRFSVGQSLIQPGGQSPTPVQMAPQTPTAQTPQTARVQSASAPQLQGMPAPQIRTPQNASASLPTLSQIPVPDAQTSGVNVSFGDKLMKALSDPGLGAMLGGLAQAILPPGTPGHEIGKLGQQMAQARSMAKLLEGGPGGATGAAPFGPNNVGGPGGPTSLEIAGLGPQGLASALQTKSDLASANVDRTYKAALASGVETPQQMLERQVMLELLGQKPAARQYDEFKTDIGPGGQQEKNPRRKHIWLRDRNSGEMLYIHPSTEPEPVGGGSGSGERFKQTSADAGVIDSFLYREFEPKIIAGIRRTNKNADVQEELAQLYDPLKGEVKKDRVMRYLLPEDKKAWAQGFKAYTQEYTQKGHGADLFSQRVTQSIDSAAIDVGAALTAVGIPTDEKNKAAAQKILESNRDKGTNIPLTQKNIDIVWQRMGNN